MIMGFLWSIDNHKSSKLKGESVVPELSFIPFILVFIVYSSLFHCFTDVKRRIPVYFRLISTFYRKELNEHNFRIMSKTKTITATQKLMLLYIVHVLKGHNYRTEKWERKKKMRFEAEQVSIIELLPFYFFIRIVVLTFYLAATIWRKPNKNKLKRTDIMTWRLPMMKQCRSVRNDWKRMFRKKIPSRFQFAMGF